MADVPRRPATSIDDVITRMLEIDRDYPPSDGVAVFNRMYLTVTQAVKDATDRSYFANSSFLEVLDVRFANLYFDALELELQSLPGPACWNVLWRHRDSPARAPLQFALAGMSAHINHDLVLAVIETLADFGSSPHDTAMHADFNRVNTLLDELQPQIRHSFITAIPSTGAFDHLESHISDWSITRARAVAWEDAKVLWHVRNRPELRRHYEELLDHAVAAAGACLLLPIEQHHHVPDHACGTQTPLLATVEGLSAAPR